jgi:hypothetical protein
MLLEFAAAAPVATTKGSQPRENDFRGRLAWRYGVLTNVTLRDAIGLAAAVTTDHPSGPIPSSLEFAYRRWIVGSRPPIAAVDLSFGYAQARVPNAPFGTATAKGVTIGAAFVPIEYFGLIARADLLHADGRSRKALMAGVEVGSFATPVAAAILVIGLIYSLLTLRT